MPDQKPFDERCSPEIKYWLNIFRTGAGHLSKCADNLLDNPWEMMATDPRRAHNHFVHCLVSVYFSKHATLSRSLLRSLENDDYLTYALCGRALIEMVATLRYYVFSKYKPILDRGNLNGLTAGDLQLLVKIDDEHLRGTRFDWESFVFGKYSKLVEDTASQLKAKKQGKKIESSSDKPQQVNVVTCLDKWASEMPEVQVIYNLFCDLVHPNIGSNFLVASVDGDKLHFAQNRGAMVGHSIFEQSFPMLVSVVIKPWVDSLTLLMGTRWQADEVETI